MVLKSKWTEDEREEIVRWISLAMADREAAAHLINANLFGIVSYHLQQVAEKLLKAFLFANDVKIDKTHDIQKLLLSAITICPELISINNVGVGSARMTDFATEYRYPNSRGNDLGDLNEVKGGLEYTDTLYMYLEPVFGSDVIIDALSYVGLSNNPFDDSSLDVVKDSLGLSLNRGKTQTP